MARIALLRDRRGLAPSGYTAAQLFDGKEPRPEWKAIEQGLVERTMERIELRSTIPE